MPQQQFQRQGDGAGYSWWTLEGKTVVPQRVISFAPTGLPLGVRKGDAIKQYRQGRQNSCRVISSVNYLIPLVTHSFFVPRWFAFNLFLLRGRRLTPKVTQPGVLVTIGVRPQRILLPD